METQAEYIIETNEEYHADTSRISNSMLSQLKASPELFRDYYITKTRKRPEPTDNMRLGSLLHCMTLEPHLLSRDFALMPKVDRRTRDGKLAWEEFKASSQGKTIVDQDEYDIATQCTSRLLGHDEVGGLLKMQREHQIGIVEKRIDFDWHGVPMRCKPDLLVPFCNVIIDIKTTKDASPYSFAKSVADYGYARQAALYREAVYQQEGAYFRFLFAVVCTSEPFAVACYELDAASLRHGESEATQLVYEYQDRLATNIWIPDWSSGVVPLSLPNYVLKRG